MKAIVVIAIMTILGATTGLLVTRTEFSGVKERFVANNGSNHYEERIGAVAQGVGVTLEPTAGAKVVVVNGEIHRFGVMEKNGKMQHAFLVKNEGTVPLRLESGGTSCPACTVSELPKNVLQPGETMPVTVQFTGNMPDYEYRKEAYIKTSDPNRRVLMLVVQGQVLQTLRVQPEDISIESVPASEGATRRFYLLVTKDRPVEILSHEFVLADNAEFFDVQYRPATKEELSKHQTAFHGYVADLTIKPGLPLGGMQQTLRFKTNWEEISEVNVPIQGTVTSDISLLGSKSFEEKNSLLKIGIVKQGTETKVTVPLVVRGPLRNDVQFKVARVEPEGSLVVSIGEPKVVGEGAVVMRTLTVTVPADSPPVSRFGGVDLSDYGKIVLETTHPDAKELRLLVRFAVQAKTSE
jgi:hypothetical protein